ncbi:MAG: hypothetical protein ACJ76N_17530 [Thermoanaerobaculia bacterium]
MVAALAGNSPKITCQHYNSVDKVDDAMRAAVEKAVGWPQGHDAEPEREEAPQQRVGREPRHAQEQDQGRQPALAERLHAEPLPEEGN